MPLAYSRTGTYGEPQDGGMVYAHPFATASFIGTAPATGGGISEEETPPIGPKPVHQHLYTTLSAPECLEKRSQELSEA